jgi:hypothetical protein
MSVSTLEVGSVVSPDEEFERRATAASMNEYDVQPQSPKDHNGISELDLISVGEIYEWSSGRQRRMKGRYLLNNKEGLNSEDVEGFF